MERHDLLSGEPRYIEDEIRNISFSFIVSLLAVLFGILMAVMAWLLYARDRKDITLWHAIICTIITVFCLFCIVWASSARSQLIVGQDLDNCLTELVYIGAILAAVYLFVAALFLVFYHYIHGCRLLTFRSNQDDWNDRMPDSWSWERGWTQNQKIIWWMTFTALVIAICLSYVAFSAWSVTLNRFKFSRYSVFLSSVGLILFGWLVVFWAAECKEWIKFPSLNGVMSLNNLNILFVLGIIAIVVGFTNLIVSFLKLRYGHYIIGFISAVLIVVTVCACGLLLRELYQEFNSSKMDSNCFANLSPIHEEQIRDWCPKKYVTNACNKESISVHWENDNKETSLNPGCCQCVKQYYLWPFFILGIFAVFLIFSFGINVSSNFYLSENYDSYGANKKLIGGVDFLFLILGILLLIGFGAYFYYQEPTRISEKNFEGLNSFADPVNYPNKHFKIVSKEVKELHTIEDNGCTLWNENIFQLPTFDIHSKTCSKTSLCIMRFQLLSRNADVKFKSPVTVRTGNPDSRKFFFPDCSNKSSQFYTFFGTEEEIQALVKSLEFCPNNPTNPSADIAYVVDQVETSKLDNLGMKGGEYYDSGLKENDGPDCLKDWKKSSEGVGCVGNCSYLLSTLISKTVVKGQLWYTDNNGIAFYDVHKKVIVRAFRGLTPIGGPGKLYSLGIFVIPDIPVIRDSNYPITIHVIDETNIFQEDVFDVMIPAQADTEVSAGKIKLISSDGKHCELEDESCLANRQQKAGDVTVTVVNSETGVPVPEIDITLASTHSFTGQEIKKEKTNEDGKATFKTVNYGPYTVTVIDKIYAITNDLIDLDKPLVESTLHIIGKGDSDMKIQMKMDNQIADFDLKLYVRNPDGKECIVSPSSKYCGFSRHSRDIKAGESGTEVIEIKQLAQASYKTTIEPSPTYNGQCPEMSEIRGATLTRVLNEKHDLINWDWSQFKKIVPLSKIVFKIFTSSKTLKTTETGNLSDVMNLMPIMTKIESKAGAMVSKMLLNVGGSERNTVENTYISTSEELKAKSEGENLKHDGKETQNLVLVNCFTGFGSISEVNIMKTYSLAPSWIECDNLIENRFNVQELVKAHS